MATRLELLTGFLEFFASPADQQVEHLRRKGMQPDAFLLEFVVAFEDLAAGALDLLAEGELDARQMYSVKKLGDWLRELRGEQDPGLWTEDALRSAWQWENAREMAQDCLLAFRSDAR